jgi:branched-chain amino acid transport system permease protein
MFWTGIALAINIVFGFTGYVPFGYFAFYGIGSYGFAMTVMHFEIPLLLAVLIGGSGGLLLGVAFLPMFRLDGIYFAIANFAGAYAVRIAIELSPNEITGGANGIELASAYSPLRSYYALLILTIAVCIVTLWLLKSRIGIMLKALRDNPTAAETSGINGKRIRSYAWLLSATFAGLFGAVDAWKTAVISPQGSFNVLLSVRPLLYTIFGGPATLLGPVLGASSLYSVDTLSWLAFPLGSYFLTGITLILAVLLFPRGVVGELKYRKVGYRQIINTCSKIWKRVVS